jgi:regulator of protease activity HflC (stomatin/prohibitin superfamily)
MPADDSIRIRLHQRLVELLDPELADAMMESMRPTPWDQLATKTDLAAIDLRFDRLDATITAQGERLDATITAQGERLDATIAAQGERLDAMYTARGERFEAKLDRVESRLAVRYMETTRMIVFAMMTLFVGTVAAMVAMVG